MSEQKDQKNVKISIENLEKLIGERQETLFKVNENLRMLTEQINKQREQAIGLNHRISELSDLLK